MTKTVKRQEKWLQCECCHKQRKTKNFVSGVCGTCSAEGYWMDVAGGLHDGQEDDLARQYK